MEKTHLLAIGNDRLRRLATYASISVALVLIVAKLAAYFLTDSVAMLSSLLDSTIDLLASAVTAFGVASALRPPDHDHRFGHGKAEPLAALAQAAFIIGSSVLLGYEALSRLYHPHEIQREAFGYGVMALAIVLTIVLVEFQHYVIRRTSSLAIGADRLHYLGDLLVNMAVVVTFALHQWTGLSWFDPVFALLIAGGLIYSAYRIALHALDVLMDKELPDGERDRIKAIVCGHPSVRGIHDMRTRSDSDHVFMELHIEMDAGITLREAHEIAEAIEIAVSKDFPNADILIHQDPAGLHEQRRDTQIGGREQTSS
jgi:ferrous-iron efflux pump FieF